MIEKGDQKVLILHNSSSDNSLYYIYINVLILLHYPFCSDTYTWTCTADTAHKLI